MRVGDKVRLKKTDVDFIEEIIRPRIGDSVGVIVCQTYSSRGKVPVPKVLFGKTRWSIKAENLELVD